MSGPTDCTSVTKQMTSASDKQMNMSDPCCHSAIPMMYKHYGLLVLSSLLISTVTTADVILQ